MESCSVSNITKECEFYLWFEDEGSIWPAATELFFPKSSLLYLEEGRGTPNFWSSFASRVLYFIVLYFITMPLLLFQKHKPITNLQKPSWHTPRGMLFAVKNFFASQVKSQCSGKKMRETEKTERRSWSRKREREKQVLTENTGYFELLATLCGS